MPRLPLLCLAILACAGDAPGPEAPPALYTDAPVHPSLAAHSALFEQRVETPAPGVLVAIGYGLANSVLLVGPTGNVVVDTLESVPVAQQVQAAFAELDPRPASAVVLTHNHADHVMGGTVFAPPGSGVPVYAHATTGARIQEVVNVLRETLQVRSDRMFGTRLDDAGRVNCGIGPELRLDPAHVSVAWPSHTFEDTRTVQAGGLELQLVHAPGETPDQLFVWLPDQRVLLPGDNIYQAFPNLYTIRGTPYRDPMVWVASLDAMRALRPAVLVPAHGAPVVGEDEIAALLTDYRDAIQYVHDQTIRGINQGLGPDELAARIALPPHLAHHPWLAEHYGRVPWSVRAIYAGTLGWFDGNAATLEPLPPTERAQRLAAAMQAGQPIGDQARAALADGDPTWAAELAHTWTLAAPEDTDAPAVLAQAFAALGAGHKNPNARHWYLTQAAELRGQITLAPTPPDQTALAMVDALPIARFMTGMSTRLKAEETLEADLVAEFVFTDVGQTYVVHVRRGVAEVRERSVPTPDLRFTTTAHAWRRLATGHTPRAEALADPDLQVDGELSDLIRFFGWFET